VVGAFLHCVPVLDESRYQMETSRNSTLVLKGVAGRREFKRSYGIGRAHVRREMKKTVLLIIAYQMLGSWIPAQEQARDLKGDGHLLGETAEQFFSEGFVGDLARACQGRDWKTVRQLSQKLDYASRANAKDICARQRLAKEQATSGTRLEYNGRGDGETMRADTFTFDRGHLVKIDMVYIAPIAKVEGFQPKSFSELFAGLQQAYGSPSKSYSEPKLDVYGVKYDAHRAVWMGQRDVISIIEEPGTDGRTEIVAETLAEYNRPPKPPNPLQ
jgi:hypothetical protein